MLNPQPFERIIVATCTLFLDSWHPFDGQSSNFGLEGISGSINIATGPSGNAPHGISIRSRDAVLHQPGRIAVLVGTGGGIFVRSGFSLFQSIGDVMKTLVGLLKLLVTSSISGLSIFDNICSLVVEVANQNVFEIRSYLDEDTTSMGLYLLCRVLVFGSRSVLCFICRKCDRFAPSHQVFHDYFLVGILLTYSKMGSIFVIPSRGWGICRFKTCGFKLNILFI